MSLLSDDEIAFTSDDDAHMHKVARLQAERARPGRALPNDFKRRGVAGQEEAFYQGLLGEWAVADALGVPRRVKLSAGGDGGVDVLAPSGASINVRYRPRLDADLMVAANHPAKADWLALVVPTERRLVVRLAGGLPTAEFYLYARSADFGHGPTWWVHQGTLRPWDVALEQLR